MKIVKPYAKILENTSNIHHAVKCAQICYASQKEVENEHQWLRAKWTAGHKSIFRHQTFYYAIPISQVTEIIFNFIKYNPYVGSYKNNRFLFISINGQTYKENPWIEQLHPYETSELGILSFINTEEDKIGITKILRRTVLVQTQVSTSRELNRTSPNNISEQSTRYCNFSNDKFGGHIAFCEPHWSDLTTYYNLNNEEIKSDERIFFKGENNKTIFATVGNANFEILTLYPLVTNCYDEVFAENWLRTCLDAEERYFEAIKNGVKPEDTRGLLPLDVATKVVYTYRVEEWDHILDLRYYGKFGKPHPNAKFIANCIRIELNKTFSDPWYYGENKR